MKREPGMTNEAKPALVPKLRFPEFRDGPGWNEEPMGRIYSFKGNNSLARDKLNYAHGTVKNIHYGDIHTKFQTHFDITREVVPFINPSEALECIRAENYCEVGDVILADASEDLGDIGKSIEVINLNGERVVSGLHTILARPEGMKFAIGFSGHLFKSQRVRAQIQRESQGTKVLGISPTRLTKIFLALPPTRREQQKIAECLSTLDEMICVTSQKLDALKAHKKGLMQQLFPREGETLPRLRFPEFQDDWKEASLENLSASISSGRDERTPFGTFDLYGSTGIIGKTSTGTFIGAFLLVARVGANAGFLARVSGSFGVTDNTLVVDLIDKENNDFIFHYLVNVGLNKMIFGSGQPLITGGQLKALPILLPHKSEQKRIASCLSSLDDLIAAQGEQLEALKTHKKGLMQQLFPSLAEAEA